MSRKRWRGSPVEWEVIKKISEEECIMTQRERETKQLEALIRLNNKMEDIINRNFIEDYLRKHPEYDPSREV